MKLYYGTKILLAAAMTLGAYNQKRGWDMPEGEDPEKEGYLVEYKDGGEPNCEDHNGYISWSPKDVFEAAYQPTDGLSFGHALVALKQGHKVARKGWNGKGQFLFLVDGSKFIVNRAPLNTILKDGEEVEYRPHIDIRTADGSIGTWSPSNSDALADDWMIIDNAE